VVEAHQGLVKYLSKPGEGAHFCLKLPLIASTSSTNSKVNSKANKQEKSHESS
jgi:two-component system sensor histidine kinase FlrB